MISFKQHNENPLVSLGVGKLHFIKFWLDKMKIKNYVINDNLTIDVNSSVNLESKELIKFPDYIQFNKVHGDFWCANNNLSSLRGCPKIVNGNFGCSWNNLSTLEHCPEYVGKCFYCHSNKKQFNEDEVKKYCIVGIDINV